ncbi:epidermal differentiation-specific protein-like [Mytilus edulis]|uniref:epidermal differentiation-specific protein-like n=1 Tax=Mytilus edulis TaxID=6550 RepID=UPI0039F03B02
MEGDRINLKQVQPIDKGTIVYDFDNILSSLKPLKGDFTVEPNIEVFEHDFKSRSIKFKDDIRDLRWYNMNDKVSYISVKSGGWIGFEHVDFRGIQTLFLTGDHKMTSSDGVFQNDKYSSFRAIKIAEPLSPVIVDRIEFHLDQANHRDIPVNVFLWRQKNKTNTLQRLSITKEKSITTEDTYEFRWNHGTKMTSHFEMTFGIPKIGFGGSMSIGMEVSHDIGSTQGTKTAKTETWTVHYPSDILPQTELKLTSNLTQAKLDVPFTAHFKQGNKKWEERGTYWGVQYYGFITEFEETRL